MNTVLKPEPQSAGRARRLVAEELHRIGHAALCELAELLTSEVVTNALIHARSPVTVEVVPAEGGVRISVGDRLPVRVPARPRGATDSTTGRGLALVEALASRWGQTPTDDGKIVWFELEAARP